MDEYTDEQAMRRYAFALGFPVPPVSFRLLSPERLVELAGSSDHRDRHEAATHPHISAEVRNVLARDISHIVACAAVMCGADYPEARPDMLVSNWPREYAKLALRSGDVELFEQLARSWAGSAADLVHAIRDVRG